MTNKLDPRHQWLENRLNSEEWMKYYPGEF